MIRQTIRNKTHYPILGVKTHFNLQAPDSYSFFSQKRQGYETRLYYQYIDCLRHNGFTCFLTLTYNDKRMPNFMGYPCFDVEDLRYLLHGAFYKNVTARGYSFKYFVTCELGEGKGKRGYLNNPHYHLLLFFKPDKKVILKEDFLDPAGVEALVKEYWQGFNDHVEFHDYRTETNLGIVRAGKFGVEVNGLGAIRYVCKYVVKDPRVRELESRVKQAILDSLSCPSEDIDYEFVESEMRKFRNRYSDKVRISHGVGEYGKQFITDKLNPSIPLPNTKGKLTSVPLSLYYYRKLYMDIVKDFNGNNRYILNELGQQMKINSLSQALSKCVENTINVISVYSSNPSVLPLLNPDALKEIDKSVLQDYALYKIIYEHRQFNIITVGDINPCSDYRQFIKPCTDSSKYSEEGFSSSLYPHGSHIQFYSQHPYFAKNLPLFDFIDSLSEKLALQKDKKQWEDFNRIKSEKRFFFQYFNNNNN